MIGNIFLAFSLFLSGGFSIAQMTSQPELKTRARFSPASKEIAGIRGMQCVTFDPKTLTTDDFKYGPLMFGRLHWLYGMKGSQNDRRVLKIIQHYGMNASCWIDDPFGPFHFMLVDGKAPSGKLKGEDCHSYTQSGLHLENYGPGVIRDKGVKGATIGYRLVYREKDFSWWLFWFKTKHAAFAALDAIHQFGFTELCWFERPYPSLHYLKAQ